MSHRIVVMKGGEIVEQGEAEQVLAQPASGYAQALVAAAPRMDG